MKHNYLAHNIIQIIPANPTCYACYKNTGGVTKTIVALWALCEDDNGDRFIRGMECDNEGWMEFCDSVDNFTCYSFVE